MRILLALICVFALGNCTRKIIVQQVSPPTGPATTDSGGGATDVGGGGDAEEARWMSIALALAEQIRKLGATRLDVKEFDEIRRQFPILVKEAKIEFKNYPLMWGIETVDSDNPGHAKFDSSVKCADIQKGSVDGFERDAINFQSARKIKVSRPRFRCLPDASEAAHRLVLHEYLGLMDIDERENEVTNYMITNAILDAIKTLPSSSDGYEVVPIKTCDEFLKFREPIRITPGSGQVEVKYNHENHRPRIIRLMNDIDCGGRVLEKPEELATSFEAGHLDGNGYSLKNLTLKAPSYAERHADEERNPMGPYMEPALFQWTCGKCSIRSLRLENIHVINGYALLVARNTVNITHVSVEGVIEGDAHWVGGLVAFNGDSAKIENCSVRVRITQNEPFVKVNPLYKDEQYGRMELALEGLTGGIAANNTDGLILNSRAHVTIERDGKIGGIAGEQKNTGLIRNSSVVYDITARTNGFIGGFVGVNYGSIIGSRAEGILRLTPDSLFQKPARDYWLPFGVMAGANSSSGGIANKPNALIEDSSSEMKVCGSSNLEREIGFDKDLKPVGKPIFASEPWSPSTVLAFGRWHEAFRQDRVIPAEYYMRSSKSKGVVEAKCE